MKVLSSIIIEAIHCSQQSVNQSAAVEEFADQRLTCRQQCFKYEIVDFEYLLAELRVISKLSFQSLNCNF